MADTLVRVVDETTTVVLWGPELVREYVEQGQADVGALVAEAETARDTTLGYKNDAQGAASSAATSETNAATSATSAAAVVLSVKAAIGSDLTEVVTDAYGQTTPVTGSNTVLNNSYGANVAITRPMILNEIGGWMSTAGNFELRIRRPEYDSAGVSLGTYTLLKLVTITSSGTGTKSFTATDGVPNIMLLPGDQVFAKMTVGRFAVTATGAGQLRVAGADTSVEGQTGLTAAAATTSGETLQFYFKGLAVPSSLNTRIAAAEKKLVRPLSSVVRNRTTLFRQRFTSISMPTNWVAASWTATTSGLQPPAATNSLTTFAYFDKGMMFASESVSARVLITDTAAIHGIGTSAFEATENGTLCLINPTTSKIEIYSWDGGTVRTLRASSGTFAAALVSGREYLLVLDKTRFSTTYTLTDTLTQAVIASVTLAMAAVNDAGSKPRMWGRAGYLYYNGSAAGITFKKMARVAKARPNPFLLIIGDSVTEGPTLGANYNQTWAYRLADALPTGSVLVTARGGDETVSFVTDRIEYCLTIWRPENVIIDLGTNDGNTSTFTPYYQKIVTAALATGANVYLCSIIPRNDPGSADQLSKDAFNSLIFGNQFGSLPIIDFAAAVSVGGDRQTYDPTLYDTDKTHPNLAGQGRLFAQVGIDAPELLWG